jgi:chromosome segregation ATPase
MRIPTQPISALASWVKALGLLGASCFVLSLSGAAWGQSIFTCVDKNGRRLTSDRPIQECIDREQKELNPSGSVKRNVGPSLTAAERAEQEARDRRVAEEQNRLAEERRRDRALLSRYPNRAAHDKERREALSQIDELIALAEQRIDALGKQRQGLDKELEFYQGDRAKAPPRLRRLYEDVDKNVADQRRVIADRGVDKQRVNTRFDAELQRLQQLWAANTAAQAPGVPVAVPRP